MSTFWFRHMSIEARNLDEAISIAKAKWHPSWTSETIFVEIPCPLLGKIAMETVIAHGGRVTRRSNSLYSLRDERGEKAWAHLDLGTWGASPTTAAKIRKAHTVRADEWRACFAELCPGRQVFARMEKYYVCLPPLDGSDDGRSFDPLEVETVFQG